MNHETHQKLDELLLLPVETEWVEFKEAKGSFDADALGRYFSALSNEANLNSQPFGWLVFGVANKAPREIVGTHYKDNHESLNKLKHEIAQGTNHQLTFHAIHEICATGKRVLVFQIPAAINGVPTEWRGRVYGRHGESLSPLSLSEIDAIRAPLRNDWSAKICEKATFLHLDPFAMQFARLNLKRRTRNLNRKSTLSMMLHF